MKPKEKAKELLDKYLNPFNRNGCIPPNETTFKSTAKQYVLITVDEIMKAPHENCYMELIPTDAESTDWFWNKFDEYWNEVKKEIEKL